MNRQWMSLSFSAKESNQRKLVAALFSIKDSAWAGAVVAENQEATGKRVFEGSEISFSKIK